ncbi:hypothetical protein SLA2020_379540 [Shorea laevis]
MTKLRQNKLGLAQSGRNPKVPSQPNKALKSSVSQDTDSYGEEERRFALGNQSIILPLLLIYGRFVTLFQTFVSLTQPLQPIADSLTCTSPRRHCNSANSWRRKQKKKWLCL